MKIVLPTVNYDLNATLTSGQTFRWRQDGDAWQGVVHGQWVRLMQDENAIVAEVAGARPESRWLTNYLQTGADLKDILTTFPNDAPLRLAVEACRGLRLLRQDPWECLASFICSSTKQIVQIQEIIRLLCERFGAPLDMPRGQEPAFAFPTPDRIAECAESDLRACKMGFRAPYLVHTARAVTTGQIDLARLNGMTLPQAREALMGLPGVGRKIADCVLLFAYGFPRAFPVDVWVIKALRRLYFPRRRRMTLRQLLDFSESYFGPNAGYAQQYLFHYARVHAPTLQLAS